MSHAQAIDNSNEDYHGDTSAIGNSGLKILKKTPLHFWAEYLDPERERKEPTAAMKFGTAWHTAVFEPGKFDDDYTVIPEGLDRRTKEGKAIWAAIIESGKTPLPHAEMDDLRKMAKVALEHPITKVIFGTPGGIVERSFYVQRDEGHVRVKIRPDYCIPPCAQFPNGLIVDGKTTTDASPDGFAKQVWNLGYHFQAALYADVFQETFQTKDKPPFLWLAQEKERPYACAYYAASQPLTDYARTEIEPLLQLYRQCKQANKWPGYSQEVLPIEMPQWAEREIMNALTEKGIA